MTSSREVVLIGGVLDQLKQLGSWCGETHIQKTCYVAKTTVRVPFESQFVLYKHGPYSFDMNSALNEMRSRNIVSFTPQGGYGVSFSLNRDVWAAFNRATSNYFDGFFEEISFVCSRLARKNVAELERVSTAVYVSIEFPQLSLAEKQVKLRELKPHITADLAIVAFTEAEPFLERVSVLDQ